MLGTPLGSPVLPYLGSRASELLDTMPRTVATWRPVGADLGMTNQELDQFAAAFADRA